MWSLNRGALVSPFVLFAVSLTAMAGTITPGDLSNSSSLDGVLVVESVEDQDGNTVQLPTDFLSSPSATSRSGFLDRLSDWLSGLDLPSVEIGEEIFHADTGDTPPTVEQGVLTDTLVTPDLRVPEPTGNVLAALGFGGIILLAVLRRKVTL